MDDTSSLVRRYPVRVALGDAWAEHRRYVAFAAGLFAFGVVVGIALALAGVDLLDWIAELLGEELLDVPEELTARFFIANNTLPYVLSIVGVITLGVYTAWIMVFNGIVVGNVGAIAAGVVGVDVVLVLLAPHGVFELPALFVAAGVGFRLLHRFVQRVLGRREAFVTKPYLYRTALLVLVGWLALAMAAVIEAHVTGAIGDALFGDRLDALERGATNGSTAPERIAASVVTFALAVSQ